MAHRLDAVAVGVAQESGIVGRVIVPQPRRAIIGATGGDAGIPERVDLGLPSRLEAPVAAKRVVGFCTFTDGDGVTEERTSTTSYKFKSEGTVVVGSCILQAIHGEADITNEAGRRSHRFQLYFPELKLLASAVDAEPIVDSLSTVLSEIKHVN